MAKDLSVQLLTAENPLLVIYNQFQHVLNDFQRTRLLQSATTALSKDASDQVISRLFRDLQPGLDKIDVAITRAVALTSRTEAISSDLVVLAGSFESSSVQYKGASKELYRALGQVEAVKLWADLQLTEYRSIFENYFALGINSLGHGASKNEDFERGLNKFTACQGKSGEIHSRLTAVKERCGRYNLLPSLIDVMALLNGRAALSPASPHPAQPAIDRDAYSAEHVMQLRSMVEELQSELEQVREMNVDLERDLFQIQHSKDQTPAALLFFATLQEPHTVPSLHQLLLQLKLLGSFVNGNEHMDFLTLRQRLQVCVGTLPALDKFLFRFDGLYKKWVRDRLKMFSRRSLTGGNADSSEVCPLCCSDMRYSAPAHAQAPVPARASVSEKIPKKSMKPSQSVSFPSLF